MKKAKSLIKQECVYPFNLFLDSDLNLKTVPGHLGCRANSRFAENNDDNGLFLSRLFQFDGLLILSEEKNR